MKEQGESPSVTRKTEIDNIFNELRERISVEAELSSTARACLLSRGITGNIQWVMNLVSRP